MSFGTFKRWFQDYGLLAPGPIGSTTPSTGKFTTLQTTGAATLASASVTGALAAGSIPSPGAIGGTTPAAGAFTTLNTSGLATLNSAKIGGVEMVPPVVSSFTETAGDGTYTGQSTAIPAGHVALVHVVTTAVWTATGGTASLTVAGITTNVTSSESMIGLTVATSGPIQPVITVAGSSGGTTGRTQVVVQIVKATAATKA